MYVLENIEVIDVELEPEVCVEGRSLTPLARILPLRRRYFRQLLIRLEEE